MVIATTFACTSPETKTSASSSDPDTGTFSSQNEKFQKVREAIKAPLFYSTFVVSVVNIRVLTV